MSFVMQLDVDKLADLIVKAYEKELEDKLWEKWLVELPNMNKGNFVSFGTYKEQHLKKIEETLFVKTDEQVMQDAEGILNMMNKP